MPAPDYALLLDPPAFPAERYANLADRLASLIATKNYVLIIQASAILAIEAVATTLTRPSLEHTDLATNPH